MRFLFDEGALYVGAKMFDTEGRAGVRTSLVRRDASFNSDYMEVVIDGFHDHLGRAFFQVNPSGSKFDMLGIGSSCCDDGWNPIWEAATRIDDDGWSAEIRIPLSQLRFSSASSQTWGLQLRRWIQRRNELQQWAFWRKNESGGPNRFGHLEGLEFGERSGKQLEPSVRRRQDAEPVHANERSVQRRQRAVGAGGPGRQIQPQLQFHARRDIQSRLQAGGSRSRSGEPDRV